MKENGKIVTWISAMSFAIFGDRENQKRCIPEKFELALAVLEARAASEQQGDEFVHEVCSGIPSCVL